MATESDGSGSDIAKVLVDTSEEETKTTTYFLKGYCLYKYITNRTPTSPVEAGTQKTVLKFLKDETSLHKNFSLSLLRSDLKTEQEAKLRDFLIKRLSRSTVYSSCGNLATLSSSDISDKPVTCYYKLIRGMKLDQEEETGVVNGDSYCSLDFLLCFVVSETSDLHLFQQELESYCKSFESYLSKFNQQVPVDTSEVFKDLENWYEINILYVCRCTKLFQLQLASLINVGLLGETLSISGCQDNVKEDINRFVDVCSLSSLLSTPVVQESNHKLLDDMAKQSNEDNELSFSESDFKFELSCNDICEVCNDWAKIMVGGELDNPVFLKQVMENYKLKVIQDMNSLKRLLMEAETNHYTLFRAYVFLSKCQSSMIVMEHIRQEAKMSTSKDMLSIIKVLEEFISEKGGFSKIRSV